MVKNTTLKGQATSATYFATYIDGPRLCQADQGDHGRWSLLRG